MPSFELSKMHAVNAPRALAASERTELPQGAGKRPGPARDAAAKSGIAVEIAASANAGKPPVDTERVVQIREALRDGTYPLVPTKIADAIIAARISFTIDVE